MCGGKRRGGFCASVRIGVPLGIAALWVLLSAGALAAEGEDPAAVADVAEVLIDGNAILRVRGVAAFPAKKRAAAIRARIIAAAEDETIAAGDITLEHHDDNTTVRAGDRYLLELIDADAALEGVRREVLAEATQLRLRETLTNYRLDRTSPVLLTNTLYAIAATLVAAGLLFGFRRGFKRLDNYVERQLKRHLKAFETQSARFVRAQQLAKLLRSLVRLVYAVLIALTIYFYLNFVLGLYPWTRPVAYWLFDLILDPLRSMGSAVLDAIPDLVFLVILFFVARYVLRMFRVFFEGIDRGAIKLASFEQEWAWPTYRILRLLVVIFALVVAYPYVPGSQSDAFKGISLFLGLIVSLGSSSIIANIIAGYSLAYRRPFKIGDRVKINDTLGDVIEMRVLVARLRSLKNEEIVIPSTSILNGEVVNYSTLATEQGLILHTTVGIGYETPWRQVEAMLKLAAERTPGLLRQPEPFVLQKSLGDFAVNYELNVYSDDPRNMMPLYSALHRSILDVFNEYGVAIMTPAYESDPAEPKLVPRDQWYAAPAVPPDESPEPATSSAEKS